MLWFTYYNWLMIFVALSHILWRWSWIKKQIVSHGLLVLLLLYLDKYKVAALLICVLPVETPTVHSASLSTSIQQTTLRIKLNRYCYNIIKVQYFKVRLNKLPVLNNIYRYHNNNLRLLNLGIWWKAQADFLNSKYSLQIKYQMLTLRNDIFMIFDKSYIA